MGDNSLKMYSPLSSSSFSAVFSSRQVPISRRASENSVKNTWAGKDYTMKIITKPLSHLHFMGSITEKKEIEHLVDPYSKCHT